MSLLFRNTLIHQIFGANTDVGKTLLTTALVRAALEKNRQILYLKPVSTGPVEDEDDRFIRKHSSLNTNKSLQTECLYRFRDPVSPHLAAKNSANGPETPVIPTDKQFITSVAKSISNYCGKQDGIGHVFVETAGGVHSPTLSGTTQVEAYRPLLIPTILIGEPKLGGISTTISAYESLHLRGYTIDAILLLKDDYYKNFEYLEPFFREKGIECFSFGPPPKKAADPQQDARELARYFDGIAQSGPRSVSSVIDALTETHKARLTELESMPGRARDSFWWPFVQHGLVKSDADVHVMDSAYGDYFNVYKPATEPKTFPEPRSEMSPFFDGSASWWTQSFGHTNTNLTLAAAHASGRYGHVMFPQCVHLPALQLAERLLKDGPGKGWASRVFYSDDGSTAMEVALKIALRSMSKRHGIPPGPARKRLGVLGLAGSYHGDTIGVMDACQEDGVYTCEWHDAKGYWIEPPSVGVVNGTVQVSFPESQKKVLGVDNATFKSIADVYDIPTRRDSLLAARYRDYFRNLLDRFDLKQGKVPQLGALVLEPFVMGAGGMIFVDPLFQTILIETVRELDMSRAEDDWKGLPVIFDEVFIGLHRLGYMSAGPVLGVHPDISANAKILTGGLVPLSTTLARKSVFETFLSESKADALLHGHSYTAYPVGCAVANKTLDLISNLKGSQSWRSAKAQWKVTDEDSTKAWSFWSPKFVSELSCNPLVEDSMTLGTVLRIKFKASAQGYVSSTATTLLADLHRIAASETEPPTPDGRPSGVHYRTLGDIAYLMGSLNTSPQTYRSVEERIMYAIELAAK